MTTQSNEFLRGARSAVMMTLAVIPFGALFGVLAVENGFTIGEAVMMSATIFAGASQLVGIDLFGANIAPWIVVASIFAVNFRHILYSAVIGRRTKHFSAWQRAVAFFFLVDPHFAETERRAELGLHITFGWMMGAGVTWWIAWILATWAGALFGDLISNPEAVGIDFLLPIYFLGIVMGFRKRANWFPVVFVSGLAAIAAFHFIGSPWHVSIGAVCGVITAAVLGVPKNHKLKV